MEASVGTRVSAISDPHQVADPAYLERPEAALAAAVEYAARVLELGERRAPGRARRCCSPQARLDARDGVAARHRPAPLLRRQHAVRRLPRRRGRARRGAERGPAPAAAPSRRRSSTACSPRSAPNTRARPRAGRAAPPSGAASASKACSPASSSTDSELGYDLDGHHLALMAKGDGAPRRCAPWPSRLDRGCSLVQPRGETVWACWLGGTAAARGRARRCGRSREIALTGLRHRRRAGRGPRRLAVQPPPGEGRAADRRTPAQSTLRYADVAILASILRDDLVATSLHQLYLEPLAVAGQRQGRAGDAARLLRAERNISSTAAALGVDRRTVPTACARSKTLSDAPSADFATEMDAALRLAD